MSKQLVGTKIAFLAANGFNEKDLTAMQRMAMQAKAKLSIISPEAGLLNGWSGETWGHHHAIDATLSTALGADYDMLFVASGMRSLDKLKLTAHTRRFIRSFAEAQKPIAAPDDALMALVLTDTVQNRTVSGPSDLRAAAEAAGAVWSEEPVTIDENMITGTCANEDSHKNFIAAALDFFSACANISQAA